MPLSRTLCAAAALLFAALPAQATPVGEFLARWDKLSKLGDMAQLDPDAKALTGELSGILASFRTDAEAAAAAGKPFACLPPKGQAKFESQPLFDYLSALPADEQKADMKPAVYVFLTKAYPCTKS